MLKLWQQTLNKTQEQANPGTGGVVLSGALDREPVDSAVQVTVRKRRKSSSPVNGATGDRSRSASPDTNDGEPRSPKKRKMQGPDRVNELVVSYDRTPAQKETELFTRLFKSFTDPRLTRQYKNARRALVELGSCASDMASSFLLLYKVSSR